MMKTGDGFDNIERVLEKSINCPPTDLALHSVDTLNQKSNQRTIKYEMEREIEEAPPLKRLVYMFISKLSQTVYEKLGQAAYTAPQIVGQGLQNTVQYFTSKKQIPIENDQMKQPIKTTEVLTQPPPDSLKDLFVIIMPDHIIKGSIEEQNQWIDKHKNDKNLIIEIPKRIARQLINKNIDSVEQSNDSSEPGPDPDPDCDMDIYSEYQNKHKDFEFGIKSDIDSLRSSMICISQSELFQIESKIFEQQVYNNQDEQEQEQQQQEQQNKPFLYPRLSPIINRNEILKEILVNQLQQNQYNNQQQINLIESQISFVPLSNTQSNYQNNEEQYENTQSQEEEEDQENDQQLQLLEEY